MQHGQRSRLNRLEGRVPKDYQITVTELIVARNEATGELFYTSGRKYRIDSPDEITELTRDELDASPPQMPEVHRGTTMPSYPDRPDPGPKENTDSDRDALIRLLQKNPNLVQDLSHLLKDYDDEERQ